jgi:hypothetical protein
VKRATVKVEVQSLRSTVLVSNLEQLTQGLIAVLVLGPLAWVYIQSGGHVAVDPFYAGLAGGVIGFYFGGAGIRAGAAVVERLANGATVK